MTEPTTVNLALGDGTSATQRFLRDEILARFSSPSLHELEDAAHISLGGVELVLTTDSYVVDPPVFPGGDIGRLAASGTINDLLASGAVPRFMTVGLVLGEGFVRDQLSRILDSLATAAASADVEVVAGDTKVVEQSVHLGICINTTGLGIPLWPGRRYRLTDARPGDRVLVTGTVGDHALAVLSQREGLGFERRVRSDCGPLHELILPLLRAFDGVHALRDPTRGGLSGVLHDLAEATGADVRVDATQIPVRPEVLFGCEMLGLDPIDLSNEGKMVVVVAPSEADAALAVLRRHPLGCEASLIGAICSATAHNGQVIVAGSASNGTGLKVLHRLEGKSVPRLC